MWNLERMRFLLKKFKHPEKTFFPVLIAGTKGKGTSGYYLESILRAGAVRTGFYTSPHLETPRERIRINGRPISKKLWARGLTQIQKQLQGDPWPARLGDLTYFEVMTLLAIWVFQAQKIQAGIFEVGMGGRLDATNALDAEVSVITTIDFDHEDFLGHTIQAITREKAGIIRPGAEVVTCRQKKEAEREIWRHIRYHKAKLWKTNPGFYSEGSLQTRVQKINAAMAVQAALLLSQKQAVHLSKQTIRRGLSDFNWPGRFERFGGKPAWLIDVAHNPSSIKALVREIRSRKASLKPGPVVFGAARDKDTAKMLRFLAGLFSVIILTPLAGARSQEMAVLLAQARGLFKTVITAGDTREALNLARAVAGRHETVLVTGSFYLAGEARKELNRGRGERERK